MVVVVVRVMTTACDILAAQAGTTGGAGGEFGGWAETKTKVVKIG